MSVFVRPFAILVILATAAIAAGEVRVAFRHVPSEEADRAFRTEGFPSPAVNDAAHGAGLTLVAGRTDPNSGGLQQLTDGKVPRGEDEPRANFFFAAGTAGGRVLVDLGRDVAVREVRSWSWHAGSRAPQVYTVYGSPQDQAQRELKPGTGVDPVSVGWRLVAKVDTRPVEGEMGGQHFVTIADSESLLGRFRYLLLAMERTEAESAFGNTFYSELDVIDGEAETVLDLAAKPDPSRVFVTEDGKFRFRVDASEAPYLEEWAFTKMAPMALEWYPKIAAMLASKDFEAPSQVTITFRSDPRGVAAASGSRIGCSVEWFRANLNGEALGAVFHELVHVVQQYGRGNRRGGGERAPGWLVEGIADYLRWYHFEPTSRGAEITRRNLDRARYDGNYRISANFLDWATRQHAPRLVPELNAAIREGRYSKALWERLTGHALEDLGTYWRAEVERRVTAADGK